MSERKSQTFPEMTTEQLYKAVTVLYNEVVMLQKAIDTKQEDPQVTTVASLRQTRALQKLKDLAVSPIGAVGYVKACCLTGQNVDSLFDWQSGFFDDKGKDLLDSLFEAENLIPMLKQNNVLSHVTEMTSFAKNLPSLSNCAMDIHLYDALHKARIGEESFSSQLANVLETEYKSISSDDEVDKRNQKRVLTVIHDLASKDYSTVQILAARIAEKQYDTDAANDWYHEVLRNKFASKSDVSIARIGLNLENSIQTKSPHTYIQEQQSYGISDADMIQRAYTQSSQKAR